MKIAIISDIHGNMQALESVLKDIEIEDCDKIFCLGDLAMAGPQPIETIEKIQELMLTKDFTIIQGNTDEMIADYNKMQVEALRKMNEIMGNALEDDQKIIPVRQKEFLRHFDKTKELEINGVKIFLAHGSPRKNNENILPGMPLEEVEKMIAGVDADVIFVGHTHLPCGYQTSTNQTVVNVGSVGRPFTPKPDACYAILEIDEDEEGEFMVRHSFVNYDREKAAELLRQRDFAGAEKLAEMLISPTERYPK